MKTTTALMFIASIAVLAVMTLLIFNTSDTTNNQITYTYPSEGTSTSYEIQHIVKGYEGSQYESTDYGITDAEKQAMFEQAQAKQTAIAEYQEARAIAESDNTQTFQESEADRIEQYCSDNGVLKCADIKYTCDTEYTCYLVTITCDDPSYDANKEISWGKRYDCNDWQVTVAADSFDLRRTDSSYWERYGYEW
ncbi:MAG: hypothetical protein HZC29_01420 [Thaumarchaeota archaeon]|nr:hypothetical protein [Candidatus Woesearchaeota archaeon]MBI5697167.1 hypothetical protein [Nitrososphaerota archaeon]